MGLMNNMTPKQVLDIYLDPDSSSDDIEIFDNTMSQLFSLDQLRQGYEETVSGQDDEMISFIDVDNLVDHIKFQRLRNIFDYKIAKHAPLKPGQSESGENLPPSKKIYAEFVSKLINTTKTTAQDESSKDRFGLYVLLDSIAYHFVYGLLNDGCDKIHMHITVLGDDELKEYYKTKALPKAIITEEEVIPFLKRYPAGTLKGFLETKDEATKKFADTLGAEHLEEQFKSTKSLMNKFLGLGVGHNIPRRFEN